MTQSMPVQTEAVKVTPGLIEYVNRKGEAKQFYFQANPTTFTRSRTITVTKTKAGEQSATKTDRGKAGRKYSLKAEDWKIEGLEINLDAARPHWIDAQSQVDTNNLAAVVEALGHLEALADSGPLLSEEEPKAGSPQHPSPPMVTLRLGGRSWLGYVTSVRIEEKQFTPDLIPSRLRATLSFDVITTGRQLDMKKTGGKQ
ncbi:MAG TPA: hypothetical protein VIV60_01135 [Polyangiaceae bacterium]